VFSLRSARVCWLVIAGAAEASDEARDILRLLLTQGTGYLGATVQGISA